MKELPRSGLVQQLIYTVGLFPHNEYHHSINNGSWVKKVNEINEAQIKHWVYHVYTDQRQFCVFCGNFLQLIAFES